MTIIQKIRNLFNPMLTCEQVNQFIMDYLEGNLSEQTRKDFETHMERCPQCSPFLEQYRHTIEFVRSDGQIEVPRDLAVHTLAFLRDQLPLEDNRD